MHVAVTVHRRTHVHLEVFSIWVKETDTVVTFRIIDTRATWVSVITGFTGINRRSYWNSNTSTFLVTHVNRAGTINVSSTLNQVDPHWVIITPIRHIITSWMSIECSNSTINIAHTFG